jgi:NOL1/NOP2/fmu family ribosome biogenesis protein
MSSIAGYESEPHTVQGLLGLVAGDLLDEPDPLVRYKALSSLQVHVDALVSELKRRRGAALAEIHADGLSLAQVAAVAGLGTRQRVEKLIAAAAEGEA